jgi:hypothetical protein
MVKKAKKAQETVPEAVPIAPPAAPAQPVVKAADPPKPIELGRKGTVPSGVGMPKSGKPWKVLSERSGKHKKFAPRSWEQKMSEKKRMKALRERVNAEKEAKKQARRAIAERLKQKKARKEINTMKSAEYQVVSEVEGLTCSIDQELLEGQDVVEEGAQGHHEAARRDLLREVQVNLINSLNISLLHNHRYFASSGYFASSSALFASFFALASPRA